MNLVQACLSARKHRERSFHHCGRPACVGQFECRGGVKFVDVSSPSVC